MIGILLIAIGSIGAASFYVPFKKVKIWAWESYWITQGLAAWIICPWVFALLTVPSGTLLDILASLAQPILQSSLILGKQPRLTNADAVGWNAPFTHCLGECPGALHFKCFNNGHGFTAANRWHPDDKFKIKTLALGAVGK